jgi:hypothetical protein
VGKLLGDFYPANTIEVSGESFHKTDLQNIALRLEMSANRFTQVEAYVIAEPKNEFDPNAVGVYIHETKIGYVNKDDAPEFSKGLRALGGSAWVMAGLKKVTEIDQYRVRLMVQRPIALDPRAIPFVDLSEQAQGKILAGDKGFEELHNSHWNRKQIATDDWVNTTSAITVLLTCANAADGGSVVEMHVNGVTVFRFPAEKYFDVFDAVLEVNQIAWASIELLMPSDEEEISFRFCGVEGQPPIASFVPKKAELDDFWAWNH